jgi:hypothetical protein
MTAITRGRGRPPKGADYKPKIRRMFRFAPDLNKVLGTVRKKKKAKSANEYVEAAVRKQMVADGLIKPDAEKTASP